MVNTEGSPLLKQHSTSGKGRNLIFDVKILLHRILLERFCTMFYTDGLAEIKTKREIFHLKYLIHCKKFSNTKLLYLRQI